MSKDQATDLAGDGVQGEGNYEAARRFRAAEEAFVRTGPVDQKAREAAQALDGPEADALEAARRSSAHGDIHATPKASTGAKSEHALDKDLKDSFPASDPLSASPGAD